MNISMFVRQFYILIKNETCFALVHREKIAAAFAVSPLTYVTDAALP